MFIKYLKILFTSSFSSKVVNYSNGYYLFLFLLFNFFYSNAQNDEIDFKKILIEVDGEEVYDVSKIVQDHKGYMWMATNLGLIRYNGIEGEKYNKKVNDTSIVIDDIGALFVDYQGDIWIGSISGLYKYNPDCDCINQYPFIDIGTPIIDVMSIAEDKNQDLWFGTYNGELYRYNKENNSLSKFFNEPTESVNFTGNYISQLIVDRNNNLWIGSIDPKSDKSIGLIRFNIDSGDIKQFRHNSLNPNSLLDNRISALYEDQQGQILIGTYKSGFHIYNPQSQSLKRIRFNANLPHKIHAPYSENSVLGNDPFVRIIHQDKNGGYWIGTSGKGINYFNTSNDIFHNYNFNLVNPQLFSAIYEDRQGNIWVGGLHGSGLFKTDPLTRKYNLNTNFNNVTGTYESPYAPGIIWVMTLQQGLGKMNVQTNEITKYTHDKDNTRSIGHNWVRGAYQENSSTLWVALGTGNENGVGSGNGGIDRLNIKSETFEHFKLTRDDDGKDGFSYTPNFICEDSEGYLWVTGGKGGLFHSDKEKKEFKPFKLFKNHDEPKGINILVVHMDANGDLWASDFKDEGTLYLFDRNENTFNPYLKGFKMTEILIDNKGWYLISTWTKGLVHLNPEDGTYIQYTKEDGLPSNDALHIKKGDDGIVWVGTRIGPAKFNIETGEISSLGLPKVRYNAGIFKASDDRIYMGVNDGLVSFYPHQVKGNPYPPQVNISELMIFDNNYLTGKSDTNTLKFAHNQNDISFKYSALHFSDSEKNLYQYRLKPINNEWTKARFERSARYFNLPPDDYTFEVKASNSDGVWIETPEAVSFTIKPAWWTTWWAYLLYVITFAFLVDRIYRFQLSKKMADSESKRLKEVDQLKNALFTNITHEFRTPLTVIKGMTGAIKSNIENKHYNNLENSLEIIDRNSDGLMQLINEMLDLAKIESGTMELNLVQVDIIPFVKYLTQSFHSLAEEKEINFSVHFDIQHLEMDLDVNKFTAIVTNLISNAIKFTSKKGEISIQIDKVQENNIDFFSFKIKDNGLGISEEEQMYIFDKFYQVDNTSSRIRQGTGIGLSLVKEFVELMQGSIDVVSTQGKGSIFSIKIPITNNAVLSDGSDLVSTPSIIKSNVAPIVSDDNLSSNASDLNLPLVLIIEDHIDVAHYIKTCLKGNYQIIHAINGSIGIEIALEKIPDIIISDVMMPIKDGFEVCKRLKIDELTDHIPIIMLTAKATFEDRLTGLSHGADAYLTKPFEKAELLTRIDQLILLRKKMLSKFEKTGIDRLLNKNVKNSETKFLQKIITVIHDNITQAEFGPVQLAIQLHLSESQLYRKLKATCGKSTALFIRSIRLQKAKELIQTTDKTISEISYDVGFNDPSYFSRAFKAEFGSAPSALSK